MVGRLVVGVSLACRLVHCRFGCFGPFVNWFGQLFRWSVCLLVGFSLIVCLLVRSSVDWLVYLVCLFARSGLFVSFIVCSFVGYSAGWFVVCSYVRSSVGCFVACLVCLFGSFVFLIFCFFVSWLFLFRHLVGWLVCLLFVGWLIGWLIRWLWFVVCVRRLVVLLVGLFVGWLFRCLFFHWLFRCVVRCLFIRRLIFVGLFVFPFVGWLICWLVGWLVGWLFRWFVGWCACLVRSYV